RAGSWPGARRPWRSAGSRGQSRLVADAAGDATGCYMTVGGSGERVGGVYLGVSRRLHTTGMTAPAVWRNHVRVGDRPERVAPFTMPDGLTCLRFALGFGEPAVRPARESLAHAAVKKGWRPAVVVIFRVRFDGKEPVMTSRSSLTPDAAHRVVTIRRIPLPAVI